MEMDIIEGDTFKTRDDSRIRICIGRDDDIIWWVYEDDDHMESEKVTDRDDLIKWSRHTFECGKCKGDIKVFKVNNKISSCNIRRCRSCKHQYYSKGLMTDCKEKLENDFVLDKIEIQNLIKNILKGFELKEKTEVSIGVHGSRKGDEIVSTYYFDEMCCEWTTKNIAIQGYVFKKLKPFITEELYNSNK